MTETHYATLSTVAGRLEQLSESLVEQQIAALRQFPSYGRVPQDDLRRSCERNVVRVLTTLRGDASLPPWIAEDEQDSGRRRALQGIPAEEVVAAYRAVLGVLRDAYLTEAASMDIPLDAVLLGTRRLWEITDQYSSELVSARHQVDLQLVRRQERERLSFLHNVLTGRLELGELIEAGTAYGITVDQHYWVLRARPAPGEDGDGHSDALLARLENETATRELDPLLGHIGADLAGIVARRPNATPGALVVVEGPTPLAGIHEAFVEASRLLETATKYGLSGVIDLETLSLRAAVPLQHRLSEMLHRRYVQPVLEHSGIADLLLDTVRIYLAEQRSIPAAAQAQTVHVNTLRYRIERYQAITGANLLDTVTAFEVWWALQYDIVRTTLTRSR